MKRFILSIFMGSYIIIAFSQKPSIDSSAIRTWPHLSRPLISNDGNYVLYSIENQPAGTNTLVVKSTANNWEKEIIGAYGFLFTSDSKHIILKTSDSLLFLRLGTDVRTVVTKVQSWKYPNIGRGEWLAYQLNNPDKELVLLNLVTGIEKHFFSVIDYLFDDKGNVLLVKTESAEDNKKGNIIRWVSLSDDYDERVLSTDISSNTNITVDNFNFDADGKQLAFIVHEQKQDKSTNSIWYYKEGMDKAVLRVNSQTPGVDEGLQIGEDKPMFSKNGKWIFFHLENLQYTKKPNADAVKVDVWNYKDKVLQSEQLNGNSSGSNTSFSAAINYNGNNVIRIENDEDQVVTDLNSIPGSHIIVSNKNPNVENWNTKLNQISYYLISLQDGSRKVLTKGAAIDAITISPEDKYVVYFNDYTKAYKSYDIINGKTNDISKTIPFPLGQKYYDQNTHISEPVGIAGWTEHDSSLLIYDNYDIWQVDPKSSKIAYNITHGYGRSHHIKFTLIKDNDFLTRNQLLLLTAFDIFNKYNGFYQQQLGGKKNPELLTMGPVIYYQIPNSPSVVLGMRPVKAKNENIWLVMRASVTEMPNYYTTKDFRLYKSLSNLQPQKKYNWITSELINWKQLDGRLLQGILYRPENFDVNKKYPLIITYYEVQSYTVYQFLSPGFIVTDINIPLLVSQGYLVFVPDIYLSIASISGKTNGMNALNSVVSGVQYLSKFKWVNNKRIGVNGHSFAGGLTYYLITHTHLFTAAIASAGVSDGISSYLSLNGQLGHPSGTRLFGTEYGQGRMGASLWQRPDLYLKYSPILEADHVSTPLLIMHNMNDFAVPWGQGVEMYLALKRLHKKVWMLQYDNGNHGVYGKNSEDYTIRFTQFFDHYLKGMPAPKWMVEGIPAARKGIDDGLQLEPAGVEPGPGLLISKGQ